MGVARFDQQQRAHEREVKAGNGKAGPPQGQQE